MNATSYGDDDHENENENDAENRKSSGVFSAPAKRAKAPLLSFHQLLQRVQASEEELRAELAARGAFSWKRNRSSKGKSESGGEREAKRSKNASAGTLSPLPSPAVRVLEPSFEASMLDFLLLTAAARGWRPHALPTEDLIQAMVSSKNLDETTGGALGGGYDEGLLRHALWRWSSKRTEGGRNGMRASDDGGGAGGGGGGAPGATAPSQGSSPNPIPFSAPARAPRLSFDEELHEASAEAFSGRGGEGEGEGEGDARAKGANAGKAKKRPQLPALLSLDAATVLRHEARKLLQRCPTWPEGSFQEAWRESLARLGVETAGAGERSAAVSLDLGTATSGGGALAGLATLLLPEQTKNRHGERTVVRLDASALPRDPRSRFAALFAAKARWQKEEIAPYLVGAAVAPGAAGGMGALLLAHARASQSEPDSPVFFSAR